MAEWAVARRADGTWAATRADGVQHVAHAVTDAEGAVWVHLDGVVIVVRAADRERRQAQAHGHASLEAPMPAQVTAIFAAPGDVVAAGVTLLLLEAMKMELPVKAPLAGRVSAVHCAVGDRVAPGHVLVDLEPAAGA